jgi:hypothetical protein
LHHFVEENNNPIGNEKVTKITNGNDKEYDNYKSQSVVFNLNNTFTVCNCENWK